MPAPQRLSICIVADAYLPSIGGIENHVFHLSTELKRMGHDAVVVTHEPPPVANRVTSQVESPVPVHHLAGGLIVFHDHDIAIDPRMVVSFRNLLDRERFDIVHGQSEGSYLVYEALAAARRRHIPTVLTRHSILRNKPPIVRTLLISVIDLFLRRADGLVAVSHSCAQESARFPGPVRVIPNGVDTAEFQPDPSERVRLRAEMGLTSGDVVLGYVGRLHTTKGVPLLLEVFEQIYRENPSLKLIIAGPGPLRSAVAERANASAGAIRLLEPQPFDKVASLLNAFDVFAFPSRSEAFGISLLEAMSCGLPSVAFGRWGVRDFVVGGETGLLAATPSDFREKLARLASDKGLRDRLGQAARRSVEERFSWPRIAAETVEFYRELIAG